MENPPNLCPFCGAELRSGAHFCVKCGKPLQIQPPPPPSIPQPPPPPADSVIPTPPIQAVTPTAPPAQSAQPAVATPPPPPAQSNAAGPVLPPITTQEEKVLTVVSKVSRKKGLLGVSADHFNMVVTDERLIFAMAEKGPAEIYMSMAPDLILAENPNNFMIPLDALKVIETYSGDFEDNAPDTMVVKTTSDKVTFTIGNAHSVKQQLKPVLGNRVK